MKKRHLLVICTLATLSMAACSTENKIITTTNTEKTTESNKITNSNEKFRDFELSITVDSKSITLPCTYQEFSGAGKPFKKWPKRIKNFMQKLYCNSLRLYDIILISKRNADYF